MAKPTCTIDGCEKPLRSSGATLCGMHYHRQYRHGSVHANLQSIRTGTPREYRLISAKGHPLAGVNGRAYEHRVVLFDSIGPGEHECHWCGESVAWGRRGDQRLLVVDHLNNKKGDNRPKNLVPSCVSCNTARALAFRRKVAMKAGAWSVNDTIARLRKPGRTNNRFMTTQEVAV